MEKKYVVVSLFNGMGCIWVALEKAGIGVSQRISSEVDKYAIKANDSMYPDTIQIGDVRKIEVVKDESGKPVQLKTENGIIDLLGDEIIIGGGSPCQSFSFSGKMKGMITKDEQEILTLEHYLKLKAEGFEFEGQSYLFWEYMRIKNDLNPKYFLLENVIMVEKWKNVLSRAIGVNPIRINSSLLSAQSRDRLYWTNIYNEPQGFFGDMQCMIPQPKDKGILLKDILEKEVDEKYFLKDGHLKWFEENKEFQLAKQYSSLDSDKAITQTARQYASWNGNFVSEDSQCVAMRGRNPDNPGDRTAGAPTEQRLEPRTDGKTNTLTTVQKDNLVRVKKSQVEKVLDKTGVDISKVTEPTILDVYNKKLKEDGKCITLTDPCHNNLRLVVPSSYPKDYPEYMKVLEGELGKDGSVTNAYWERIGKYEKENNINPSNGAAWPSTREVKQINPSTECSDKSDLIIKIGDYRQDEGYRWRDNGKSPTLMARAREDSCGQPIAQINSRIRRLTPRECGRLQTFPEDKLDILLKANISDSQLYKCFGNGWTCDVIAHILSYIK